MSIVDLLALFSDPASLKELTLSQKMVASLATTLLGMGITFLALVALQVVITLMARFVSEDSAVTHQVPAEEEPEGEREKEEFNEEVVAAITTSLAVLLQCSSKGLVIKSIRKVEDTAPIWSKAGIIEQTDKYL
jgi:sodium pump decarboxylase gamma subunit